MKKLFLLNAVLFVVATIFCGCSKEDDDFSGTDIVGQWRAIKDVGYEIIDGVKYPYNEDLRDNEHIIKFKKDGTGLNDVIGGTWDTFTYKISGNTLVITWDHYDEDETTKYTIEKLTNEELILYQYEESDDFIWAEHSYFEREGTLL